jgi:hypothetical protein
MKLQKDSKSTKDIIASIDWTKDWEDLSKENKSDFIELMGFKGKPADDESIIKIYKIFKNGRNLAETDAP